MINPAIFVLIYLLTLLLVATNMVGLSVSALIGALLMAFFGINSGLFTYQEALNFIDMRILGFVLGSMIIIEVAERSGLFHLISLYVLQTSGGDPRRLFVVSCLMAAVMSLFLGDSAAILLIGAAIITGAKLFKLDPVPYVVSTAIMTNLGGTSTLIGSTSNMVIGIQSKLNFIDFLSYLMPIELILWVITIIVLYLAFRSRLQKNVVVTSYDPWKAVKDRRIFLRSTMLLIIFLILLVITDQLEIGAESVALGCAILALIISDQEPSDILGRLDWETIFFLAGMLFLNAGFERTGFIEAFTSLIHNLAGESPLKATLLTIWSSGTASALFSNTAVALLFVPMLKSLQVLNRPALWSALILGTNLGGVTTPLSGSVCAISIGMLKREGINIRFKDFTKIGVLTTVLQLSFASLYLIIRFGLVV